MFQVDKSLSIGEGELQWSFVRAGGPGGQNVNKVASKAVLRWNLAGNSTLPPHVKARLCVLQRNRITAECDLLLNSQRYRDQERNRQDCLEKLRQMIIQAAELPKPRRATKPSRGARERRLEGKRHRAGLKSSRKVPSGE